ncbi:unnamed protein product [Camellia sinensis]
MGRAPCCDKEAGKRGAWTPEKDKILVDYITTHGHPTWRSLPKLAGFMAHILEEVPLFRQAHRADNIWERSDEARTVLTCRRADSGLWEHPLDHRVLQYVLRAGFYGV